MQANDINIICSERDKVDTNCFIKRRHVLIRPMETQPVLLWTHITICRHTTPDIWHTLIDVLDTISGPIFIYNLYQH
jgi:hypothetical protein